MEDKSHGDNDFIYLLVGVTAYYLRSIPITKKKKKMQVIYSLNGKYFNDYKVYISKSEGLLDKLKPKPKTSYDWAEYHGKTFDNSPVRYDEREITLSGFVMGDNWQQMKRNFDTLFSEFDKGGLVRLLVEFEHILAFDVYLIDKIELQKEFRKGQIIGSFSLKMKEPNPVKRILKIENKPLNLSFNTPLWVDISIDGKVENFINSVSIRNKIIPPRATTQNPNTHYIIIAGDIDQITDFQTNAEIIWNKI